MRSLCFVTITFGSALLSACNLSDADSLKAKHEWSVLEAAAASEHPLTKEPVSTFSRDGYTFLRAKGSTANVTVLLNPKYPPFYKQLPRERFVIAQSDLNHLVEQGVASSTVLEVLRSSLETVSK